MYVSERCLHTSSHMTARICPRYERSVLRRLRAALEPLRLYLHTDAVLWTAAYPWPHGQQPDVSSSADAPLGPRRMSKSRTRPGAGRHLSFRPGDVLPLGSLWRALGAGQTNLPGGSGSDASPQRIWRTLERAAVLGGLAAALPVSGAHRPGREGMRRRIERVVSGEGGTGGLLSDLGRGVERLLRGRRATRGADWAQPTFGFSSHFAPLSITVQLDTSLNATVTDVEPLPELPHGANGQPAWHEALTRRVASDLLNLTGATLQPHRQALFAEVRSQLHRALTPNRRRGRRRGSEKARAGKGQPGKPGAAPGGGKGRAKPSRRSAGSSAPAPPPAPACRLALPVALHENELEQCLTSLEVDHLAWADTEFLYRFGFRRVLPGANDDLRQALFPARASDQLLSRYLTRWPKDDEPFQVPGWANEEAEAAERDSMASPP